MRSTKQRNLILDIINDSCSHLTALGVYNLCKKRILNISLGTVYRNLNCLVENGKIIRIKMPDNIDRYDKNLKKHAHFICMKCNKVIDVLEEFKFTNDFSKGEVLDYEINFKGICNNCKRKGV